jgi:putative membrane protein
MNTITRFLIRWFICGLGLWVSAGLIGHDKIAYQDSVGVIVVAGLVLAILNTIIKPIVVLLSLPAILFSLGLFMIIINAAMVLLASWFYDSLEVTNFSAALLAGIIIGLVNYLVTAILDMEKR